MTDGPDEFYYEAALSGEAAAQNRLWQELSPATTHKLADEAMAAADERITRIKTALKPRLSLACKSGCAWCCYYKVVVTAPEVFRIVEYLTKTYPPERLAELKKRLIGMDERTRGLSSGGREQLRLPCPLLNNKQCSIYPVRPLACRGMNSTSARKCQAALETLDPTINIPMLRPIRSTGYGIRDGISHALNAAGLQSDSLELVAALRIAFETPDAMERWLSGEPVFTEAITYEDEEYAHIL